MLMQELGCFGSLSSFRYFMAVNMSHLFWLTFLTESKIIKAINSCFKNDYYSPAHYKYQSRLLSSIEELGSIVPRTLNICASSQSLVRGIDKSRALLICILLKPERRSSYGNKRDLISRSWTRQMGIFADKSYLWMSEFSRAPTILFFFT